MNRVRKHNPTRGGKVLYYVGDSLYPENMLPLIITAAAFGPQWKPTDADIPVSWKEQVQAAVDCQNARATHLHIHVRNPATGLGSKDFDQFNEFIGMLKQAVPKMILSVGGSISFAPKGADAKAKWLDYDTRHMLAELDPAPDQVTIATGTGMMDMIQKWSEDDIMGTEAAARSITGVNGPVVMRSSENKGRGAS